MQKLLGQESGFDFVQGINRELSATNATQRISLFGVGMRRVLRDRCQTCHTSDGVKIVACTDTQVGYFFANRKLDSELMTVPNFMDCESG